MRRLAGTFLDLTPRLPAERIRAVVRLGVGLRWVAIAFAGLAGLFGPRVPGLLAAQILGAIVYNAVVMAASIRMPDAGMPRVALVTTVIDQFFCFAFIGLYNVEPQSRQIAAYVPGMIEAVAFFGAAGAFLSSGIFLASLIFVQTIASGLGRGQFDGLGTFGATMIVILIGACLGAVSHVLAEPAMDAAPGASDDHRVIPLASATLSGRQHDVLKLLAEGCSNATIATKLGWSERRVKGCVERLLGQLKARNRAEAVASAIRTGLL